MLQRKLAIKMETMFFGLEHLKKQNFNNATQLQGEAKITQSHDDLEHDNEVCQDGNIIENLK